MEMDFQKQEGVGKPATAPGGEMSCFPTPPYKALIFNDKIFCPFL